MSPPDIPTRRLTLVSMSGAFMRALVGHDLRAAEREIGAVVPQGMPENLQQFLQYRLRQLDEEPGIARWLGRAMVLIDDTGTRRVIGTIGFHGAPDADGRLEIGYRIQPEYRRRGYTREAVRGLFDWASAEGSVHRFIASIRPDNEASLALAAGFGFVQTGTQMDEIDGLELVFETRWSTESDTN